MAEEDKGKAEEKMGEEKVEMKEVAEEAAPLKDAEANGTGNGAAKTPKKNPFAFLTRSKAPKADEPTDTAPGAEAVTEEKTPNKPRSWFWQNTKTATADVTDEDPKDQDALIFGLNLDDRDEKGINDHVKLAFEDVIAEPEGYHSFDFAWRLTFRIFTAVRSFLYKVLAAIVAVPCAVFWGLVFALLTLLNVWACVPAARAIAIPATWLAQVWNWVVRSVLDPCFRSCGLVCSSVRVHRVTDVLPVTVPVPDPNHIA